MIRRISNPISSLPLTPTPPHSSAQLDQGDQIVKIVKDSLTNGQDWRAALEASADEGVEAFTSHEVGFVDGRVV